MNNTTSFIRRPLCLCSVVCILACRASSASTSGRTAVLEAPARGGDTAHGGHYSPDSDKEMTKEEAESTAHLFLSGINTSGSSVVSAETPLSCNPACIQLDSLGPPNSCAKWRCSFIFGDASYALSARSIVVVVDTTAVTTIPAGFDKCLSAPHRCECGVPWESAKERLGGQGSRLHISWDSERNEFFWESEEGGEQTPYHKMPTGKTSPSGAANPPVTARL